MKHVFFVFCICMQFLVTSTVQAGSSVNARHSNPEALFLCLWVAAGNEDTQQEQKKSDTETEEEEEPDCD